MREETAADASRTVTFTFRSPLREHAEREKRPIEKETPDGRIPRVSRLMALAIRFDGLVREGRVKDYAELARLGFVTRARVTQIMNLLTLAPDIQEDILHLPPTTTGRDPITEHHLRPMTAIPLWNRQRKVWREIKRQIP